jgi:predicted protein tyrosine phosphatase
MRLLFVCNQGENRSRAGAELFAARGHETRYAGIHSDARPLTGEMLEWADIIFVFEDVHIGFIKANFPGIVASRRVVDLDIGDWHAHGSAELARLIMQRAAEWAG